MNPYYKLPDLGSSFQQAHAGRPDRRTGGSLFTAALQLANGLESAVRRSVGGLSRWRRRRAAHHELQALSDRHLTDIGLDRSQTVSTLGEIIESEGQPAWRHALLVRRRHRPGARGGS